MATSNGPSINNVVVVMMENRSYDNVLGWLYNGSNAPPYQTAPKGQEQLDGLKGNETNPGAGPVPHPIAVGNQRTTGDGTNSWPGTTIPIYDPGEPFNDMAQQICGCLQRPVANPYAGAWPPGAPMQGFTTNYAGQLKSDQIEAHLADVMNYFTPDQVPVTAWLASHFAVCDRWFASVPTQTFTNRAFAHCAAPGVDADWNYSFIDDYQYVTDRLGSRPSVFNLLDEFFSTTSSPPNWKVYFHDYSISARVASYVHEKAVGSGNVNVATYDRLDWGSAVPDIWPMPPTPLGNAAGMKTFFDDLAGNALPAYSFIEPRYSRRRADALGPDRYYPANSNHPGSGRFLDLWSSEVPIDVSDGETFLRTLYMALRQSPYWSNCLLIITYDEHGGLYDHVCPPSVPGQAVPPAADVPPARSSLDPAADGFNYNVYGCRVPTIIVSPFVPAASTIRPPGTAPFDHASIASTLWDCFKMNEPGFDIGDRLSARAAAAPSLYPFLSATADNNPDDSQPVAGDSFGEQ